MTLYVLNESHEVRVAASIEEWSAFFASEKRVVAKDVLPDGTTVSTVFLGIDHNFSRGGSPLLFETMTFPRGEREESDCARCSSWKQAEAQHRRMVEKWQPTRRALPQGETS